MNAAVICFLPSAFVAHSKLQKLAGNAFNSAVTETHKTVVDLAKNMNALNNKLTFEDCK